MPLGCAETTSKRSVASVAVRVTSERGRMHERDGIHTVIKSIL
jgi:hypothetical protein